MLGCSLGVCEIYSIQTHFSSIISKLLSEIRRGFSDDCGTLFVLVLRQVLASYARRFCETAAREQEGSLAFALGQVLIVYELSASSMLAASLIRFHIPTHSASSQQSRREKRRGVYTTVKDYSIIDTSCSINASTVNTAK